MQLISYSVLSSLVLAAATVQAAPSSHGTGNFQNIGARSGHHAPLAARHLQRRAPHLTPEAFKVKRASNSTQIIKRCRLRPTSVLPSTTGTVAGTSSSTVLTTSAASTSTQVATTSTTSSSSVAPTPTYSDQWKLGIVHQGRDFFDGWDFWDRDDPTHGTVRFLDFQNSLNAGLLEFNDGQPAIMRLSNKDYQYMRESVRIHDKKTFNINTLLIMDSTHMPVGCGVWPAWWTNGPNWPYGGEIDILEGVNDQPHNMATLHTGDGCWAQSGPGGPPTGRLLKADCGVVNGDNSGCGYLNEQEANTYGRDFNSNGGGVYAMQWVESGISVWFFPRDQIPADITADHPMPWEWKTPFAHWADSGCDTNHFFRDNFAIFDITACGDWAGSAWYSSECGRNIGGTCEDYIRGLGNSFNEAYWAVNYVKYFSQDV